MHGLLYVIHARWSTPRARDAVGRENCDQSHLFHSYQARDDDVTLLPNVFSATLFCHEILNSTVYSLNRLLSTLKMSAANLNRSFSVYSIPPQLLQSLAVRSIQAQNNDQQQSVLPTSVSTSAAAAPPPIGTGISCQTCPQAEFDTIEEQRTHFKSDWHRYNAKVKLNASGKVVSLEEWDNMVEGVYPSAIAREAFEI